MTDEEMAEEYAEKIVRHKMAVHCIFNEKVTKKEIKDAVIYGLKAGKDMAEADLASVAYMQGAERYKPKWHKRTDKLPEENQFVLVYDGSYIVCVYHSYTPIKWLDMYENEVYEDNIIAWCEIPIFKEL
jgi:hypothetical protein